MAGGHRSHFGNPDHGQLWRLSPNQFNGPSGPFFVEVVSGLHAGAWSDIGDTITLSLDDVTFTSIAGIGRVDWAGGSAELSEIAVPEPSTSITLGAGLTLAGGLFRRQLSRRSPGIQRRWPRALNRAAESFADGNWSCGTSLDFPHRVRKASHSKSATAILHGTSR